MTRMHERIETPLPIDAAFDYVADFANSRHWDPGTSRRPAGSTTGRSAVGAALSTSGSGWAAASCRWSTGSRTSTVRDGLYSSAPGSNVEAVDDIRFEPSGDGTHIDYTADIRLGGAAPRPAVPGPRVRDDRPTMPRTGMERSRP